MDAQRLEEFRKAAKIGFDQLDRGEYITIKSEEELDRLFDQIEAGVPVDDIIASHCAAKA